MTKPTTMAVDKPVYTHHFPEPFKMGEVDVDELPIREPNGLDLVHVGTPVIFNMDSGETSLDIPRCYSMVSRLSNVPEQILYRVHPAEMMDLFLFIATFFIKGRQMLLPALEKRKAELAEQGVSPAS